MPVFTAPPDPADPAQRPLGIKKQPLVRVMPLVNVEVPDPPTLITPVVSMTPEVVVARPTPRPPVVYVL